MFNGQPANVDWVFVDGEPLKREGEFVVTDTTVDAIVRDAQDAANGPWSTEMTDKSEVDFTALERALNLAP